MEQQKVERTCQNCALVKTCGGKDKICFEHCTQDEHERGMRNAMYLDNIAMHQPRR